MGKNIQRQVPQSKDEVETIYLSRRRIEMTLNTVYVCRLAMEDEKFCTLTDSKSSPTSIERVYIILYVSRKCRDTGAHHTGKRHSKKKCLGRNSSDFVL